jgi:hypothetical protein
VNYTAVIHRYPEEKNLYHETANATNVHGHDAALTLGIF